MEIHAHLIDVEAGAGHLHPEPQQDALVGLDAQDELIAHVFHAAATGEDAVRIGPEVYHHLRHARRQTFTRTDVERHAAPAPIVDVALHSHECLRLRLWCHAFLLAIGPEWLATPHGTRVLPADDVLRHLLGRHPTQGEEHLQHLVADGVCIGRHRRIHRPDGQQLQQVVLHHVAQCPGRLVVSGPRPDAERLG